MFFLCCWISM